MTDSYSPAATQEITRSDVTLNCALTGKLPSWQNVDPSFVDYYHRHLINQPDLTSIQEYQPIKIDSSGNYERLKLDRAQSRQFFFGPQATDSQPTTTFSAAHSGTKASPTTKGIIKETLPIPDTQNLTAQIFRPDAAHSSPEPTPVYLFAHGGGRVTGFKESGAHLLSRITASLGFPTVSFEYSLCPEYSSAAAHEDARRAFDWVRTDLHKLLGRPVSGIINGGVSSGGQVALALTNNILCDSDEDVRKSLLGTAVAMPVCDVRDSHYATDDWKAIGNPINHAAMMQWFNHVAMPTVAEREDPRNSLVLTCEDVLAKYKNGPPITIATAEYDGLSIAGKEYAGMLRKAGADVTERAYKGLPHSAQGLDNICQEARDVNVELIRMIGRYGGKSEEELEAITVESLYPDPLWASTKVPASD